MAALGNPNYSGAEIIDQDTLLNMTNERLLYSYTVARVKFQFPDEIKYPSIPCYIDESTTIYPLSGEAVLTGIEIKLAIKQGCVITVIEAFTIPFEVYREKDENSPENWKCMLNNKGAEKILPFTGVIRLVQNMRTKYPRGSINNLMYKQIGNSIYGSLVRGMNDNRKMDLVTGESKRINATVLSNPILASWTTAFIRSVIGECLHQISILGGKVISVTTDGFITDIDNLECKLLESFKIDKYNSLLGEYRSLRDLLTGEKNSGGLEIKHTGVGMTS